MTISALCANEVYGNRWRFTGKERDAESGNDYFGARYYSSAMGRMLSPDPSNMGANPANPQTWNMYSYSLNNPLIMTDPTGLYVCEDSTDCSSENDKKFAASLASARDAANNLTGDDKTNALRAVNSYGDMGVDNGVNVRFDSNVNGGQGGAVTEVSGAAGEKTADNPTGQSTNVTFKDGNASSGLVAHEGSHVADGSDWVKSGFSASMNPTRGTTESNANHVQFNIMQQQLFMQNFPNPYSASLYGNKVKWNEGATFKAITPDLEKTLKEMYQQNYDKPAFNKGDRY